MLRVSGRSAAGSAGFGLDRAGKTQRVVDPPSAAPGASCHPLWCWGCRQTTFYHLVCTHGPGEFYRLSPTSTVRRPIGTVGREDGMKACILPFIYPTFKETNWLPTVLARQPANEMLLGEAADSRSGVEKRPREPGTSCPSYRTVEVDPISRLIWCLPGFSTTKWYSLFPDCCLWAHDGDQSSLRRGVKLL